METKQLLGAIVATIAKIAVAAVAGDCFCPIFMVKSQKIREGLL